jgi:hypothetical protein
MRVFVQKKPRGTEFGILYGGIALLVLLAARFMPVLSWAPSCAFKGLTGLECPTCGSTRAVLFLAQGDILSSFKMNPLASLCFIVAVVFLLYSLLTLVFDAPRIGVVLSNKEKDALRVGAVLLVLINWTYLVVTL